MTYAEFQRQFEEYAESAYKKLSTLSEPELISLISDKKENKYGIWKGSDNYQVWRVLQEKGTVKSINPLFEIVRNLQNEYLVRYHACEALFVIAKINDDNLKGEVQYGLNRDRQAVDQQKAIAELERILAPCLSTPLNQGEPASAKPWWKRWPG
ncbi:MAG: hypothetical protein JNK91_03750 [Ferruginibacter sp.]|nr:hypothetical protein [Ferruginibacter sp.]